MSLRHCILALVDLRPMTGYDLKKAFDGSVAHFWSADQAQIYRTLARLEADGLVEVEVIPQAGKPDRREHRITAEGSSELSRWLRSPAEHEPDREPFLARIFFAGRENDPALIRALIGERRAEAQRRRDALRSLPAPDGDLAARLRTATLRNGVLHLEAELAWVDELERTL
ncbi:PadR family transcriptional regulator [Diaminobutyricimonas aerilata]|uniref:helix-turn-helix transcriptional regulator n=1 Tax=Diaminobutyricimonas aerilata TaxID=1162967 RepID=UPI000C24EF3D